MQTIRVKKCKQGYKVQFSINGGYIDIAHAIWLTKKQAITYAKMILTSEDKLEI